MGAPLAYIQKLSDLPDTLQPWVKTKQGLNSGLSSSGRGVSYLPEKAQPRPQLKQLMLQGLRAGLQRRS